MSGLNPLQQLDPERAHRLAVWALRLYSHLPTINRKPSSDRITVMGLPFRNRLGIAAGLDKDGYAWPGLMRLGFGAVEVGSLTPRPQPGNPKPRLFRLTDDRAVINRMGFNNRGIDDLVQRLNQRRRAITGVLGINIGPNKDSPDPVEDYRRCYQAALAHANYFAINLSSPNTPGLRDWQTGDKLEHLLAALQQTRDEAAQDSGRRPPMLIKIAPDWDDSDDLRRMLDTGLKHDFDGFILTNTPTTRPETLRSPDRHQAGGLSGAPLFCLSTAVLARAYCHLGDTVPLIGVGGVADEHTALAKLYAGATLVQVYTGFSLNPAPVLRLLNPKADSPGLRLLSGEDSDRKIGHLAQDLREPKQVEEYINSRRELSSAGRDLEHQLPQQHRVEKLDRLGAHLQ